MSKNIVIVSHVLLTNALGHVERINEAPLTWGFTRMVDRVLLRKCERYVRYEKETKKRETHKSKSTKILEWLVANKFS